MRKNLRFVGLDVHKASIVVAAAVQGRAPAELCGAVPNDELALCKLLDGVGPKAGLRLCYEAGPTGYGLARRLNERGYCCQVVAPSLVPRRGDRIKTDRRDARRLAHFLRSGDLTPVHVPTCQTEAIRDLERARADAKSAERVVRQQLDKFLLRQGRIWSGGSKWTHKHWAWIRQQEFAEPALRALRDDAIDAVEQAARRIEGLTRAIQDHVTQWSLLPLVKALQALRGVSLLTAVILAAEIGDFQRFASARQLMAYVGLVPSEHSSGQRRRQGEITKTGNRHARWILTEAAWNYRFYPRLSKTIEARRRLVSPRVRVIAERAERRLHRRFTRLTARGKVSQKAVTAVARELAGFVWAIAREEGALAV